MKQGKGKASVNNKVESGANTKEENNNENIEEGQVDGKIIQKGGVKITLGKGGKKRTKKLVTENNYVVEDDAL